MASTYSFQDLDFLCRITLPCFDYLYQPPDLYFMQDFNGLCDSPSAFYMRQEAEAQAIGTAQAFPTSMAH